MKKPIKKSILKIQPISKKAPKKAETFVKVQLPFDLYAKLEAFADIRGLTVDDLIRVGSQALLRQGRYHDLSTPLSFGKFAGETVETVVRLDPGYMRWLISNTDKLVVSEAVTDLLDSIEEDLGLRVT